MSIINNLINHGGEMSFFTSIIIIFLTNVLQVLYILFDNSIPRYFGDFHFFAREAVKVNVKREYQNAMISQDAQYMVHRSQLTSVSSQKVFDMCYDILHLLLDRVQNFNHINQVLVNSRYEIIIRGKFYALREGENCVSGHNLDELKQYIYRMLRNGDRSILDQDNNIIVTEVEDQLYRFKYLTTCRIVMLQEAYAFNHGQLDHFSNCEEEAQSVQKTLDFNTQGHLPDEIFMKSGCAYYYEYNGRVGIFIPDHIEVQAQKGSEDKSIDARKVFDAQVRNYIEKFTNTENSKLF